MKGKAKKTSTKCQGENFLKKMRSEMKKKYMRNCN
jgi:hypothetical protein